MNSRRDSIECLSNDELMLKELERRDGIYSFIFHELESPKQLGGGSVANCTAQLVHQHAKRLHYEASSESALDRSNMKSGTSITTAATSTAACNAAAAAATLQHFQEYLKPWHPPPTLVYDHPQLYAYMANCGFRVRVPPPRFSHVSVPLVRNRRHALKESVEYKNVANSGGADLRALFPHDPDVHAPFGGQHRCNIHKNATMNYNKHHNNRHAHIFKYVD